MIKKKKNFIIYNNIKKYNFIINLKYYNTYLLFD